MADLNGAGGGTLGGLSGNGEGRLEWWRSTAIRPGPWDATPSTAPSFRVAVQTWDGGTAHLRLQVSTSPTFATTVYDTTFTGIPGNGSESTVSASGLSLGTRYWWRVRAQAPSGAANTAGPWTEARGLYVLAAIAQAVEYAYINVSANPAATLEPDTAEYVYINVGLHHTPKGNTAEFVYVNVGLPLTPKSDTAEYGYLEHTTTTPEPRLWFLRPASGRPGDGVQIVGWGLGDLPSTYGGTVEMETSPGVWVAVPVVSWQTFPAAATAYGPDRVLDPETGRVDPQHTRIEITIPPEAVEPGHALRVRTDGP